MILCNIWLFLGVNKPAPIAFLYRELDWVPPQVSQRLESVKLWCRIAKLPEQRLTRKIWLNDKTRWMTNIKTLLCNSDLADVWNNKYELTLSTKSIIDKVQRHLLANHSNTWQENKSSTSKLCYYNLMKQDIKCEEYVKSRFITRQSRAVIAKLRSGTYPIAVELGRYRNIPKENRICKSCQSGSIEDEQHFLLKCTAFDAHRDDLFNEISKKVGNFKTMNLTDKLCTLLSDTRIIKHTVAYVLKCQKSK